MPANYDIVSDDSITLSADGVSRKDFPLETPGINVATRTVVSFMIFPGIVNGIDFKMSIINSKATTFLGVFTEGVGNAHVRQEVIDAGALQPNGNTLRVEVNDGFGSFSDIVLWYQVKA